MAVRLAAPMQSPFSKSRGLDWVVCFRRESVPVFPLVGEFSGSWPGIMFCLQ